MTGQALTLAAVLEDLNLQGVAFMPQALAPTQATLFGTRAAEIAALWAEKDAAGSLNGEDQYALSVGTVHFEAMMLDPEGAKFVRDLLAAVMAGPVWRLFRRLFGPEVGLPLRACSLRWHRPPFGMSAVPMHQDVGFMGSGFPVINCWLTFTDAGVDSAGLEIAPIKLSRELPKLEDFRRASNIKFWSLEIDAEAAGPLLPETGRLQPAFGPGDAVLFDQFTPHRTLVTPGMTRERISVELRGCRAADLTPNYRFTDKLVVTETAQGLNLRRNDEPDALITDLNKA